ncbi:MAG: hypothetical protein ACRDT6_09530 [Micromonosporaceae bacterium]
MSKIVTWLRHFAAVEPVYVRSLIGTAVTLAAVWGADLAPLGVQVETTLVQAILATGLVLTVLGIRGKVTPTAAVVARVADPAVPPTRANYLAGGYSEVPTGAAVGRLSSLDLLTKLNR